MKKIYCLLFAVLPLAAFAGEVKVTKPALTLENDTLTLDFKFNMEAVKVNSTQSYAFTPVLFAGKKYKTLPPVVVTGKNKFKMRHKDRRLAKRGYYDAPYTIIKGKSANRQDIVNYTVCLPYEEWMNEADKLFEFCAIEMRNNLELQNSVHLLYSPDIEKCVKKLLSIYESFQLGHVYFTNAEFDSAIQKIIQVSNEIQISYLLESIEQETLKRK